MICMTGQEKYPIEYELCFFEVPFKKIMRAGTMKKSWVCPAIWMTFGMLSVIFFHSGTALPGFQHQLADHLIFCGRAWLGPGSLVFSFSGVLQNMSRNIPIFRRAGHVADQTIRTDGKFDFWIFKE